MKSVEQVSSDVFDSVWEKLEQLREELSPEEEALLNDLLFDDEVEIGHVTVDTGRIVLHDSCTEGCEGIREVNIGEIEKHGNRYSRYSPGVIVPTGLGDGNYPVYAKLRDLGKLGTRVESVTAKFF
jgi:hypothetical protein